MPWKKFLKIALACFAFYLIATPYIPALETYFLQSIDATKGYKYASKYVAKNSQQLQIPTQDLKPIPKVNTLVIPKIGVDTPMLEGQSDSILNKGIWRRPNGSTPLKGGNTVLAGHRYLYTKGPHTFYNLDKVAVGDEIILFWEGKEYNYQVDKIKEVLPTAIEIEKNTLEPIVTLYTCTPLFSSKKRLVVTAKLLNI